MTAASAPAAALPTTEAGGDARFSNTFLRLKKKLERGVGEAIGDYNMIGDGDTVMVCVSGGKDSYTLLSCLLALRERAPVDFRIVAMNLDQKQPGFPDHVLPAYFESIGVEYRIVTEDTYSIVKDKIPEGKTTCSLCSRLRRGIIYRTATEIGATRIALGHHRDDMLETLFLNMFFGGKIKAMPPKLVSDDGKHVVIRPLAYCTEADIARFARTMDFPIIPCNLCGSQENAQRKLIKNMLQGWARDYPGRIESLATSLKNVVPSHLSDARLFDFVGLTQHTVVEEGDTAFDPPELPELPDRTLGASVKLFRAGDREERECA
ncbi:tRNA 2-thiocytidine(32) synthetase TtcA [Thauera sp.]|uniref:tRNA 2-thiocytidine(32) synthetase TtcA n=1 Tax=Thauera TaxID=33057 RepID=UPI001B6280F3|nr:tRNA 2-thiocytidine(32) synthetase TtcA [Thauera sp.]MBP6131547.1 tRNA 2-thiocytidine(32) synthetase TtcA [Thauera sp.]MBP7047016.1 tRNA 2-thiocytidine(32) synthetase TtcA [Thauera sp.]HNE98979.1 tRNA 2-thiocytidine(32) synthetase TtcA [Thauera aminoaromatica]